MADKPKENKAESSKAAKDSAKNPVPSISSIAKIAKTTTTCGPLIDLVNFINGSRCGSKANSLPHAKGHVHTGCKCSDKGDSHFLADLIVLIDRSSSMTEEAGLVSAAAEAAIAEAKAHCDVDLRIAYMGVEGVWPGTKFNVNHLTYLQALHSPPPAFATNSPPGGYATEEGANAVEDLSKYYDWRPDACRAIFYISDEELDGSSPRGDTANEALSVANAVAAANANDVTVFAHHITNQNLGAAVVQNYNDLCNLTGGRAYFSNIPSQAEYTKILAEAICGACGKPSCQEVEVPRIEPCISVTWGDSKCDCIETDDTEVICITVCNCYSNVTFGNFGIAAVYVTTIGGGAVPELPDGTSSVQVIPLGPTCFGDIPPCRDDKAGCVSREFVLRTRGAKGGKYELNLVGICYDVAFHYNNEDKFELVLCSD